MPKRTAFLAITLLIAGSAVATAATDAELLQGIVGSWGDTATCGEGSLVFNADGTFVMVRQGEDPAKRANGKYQIANGILSGASAEGAMPDVSIRIDDKQLFFEENGKVVTTLTRCSS